MSCFMSISKFSFHINRVKVILRSMPSYGQGYLKVKARLYNSTYMCFPNE